MKAAILPALILDREIFPFLDITEAMVTVGEVLSVNSEVVRNKEFPGDKNRRYESDGYPCWAQYMPLHFCRSRCLSGTRKACEQSVRLYSFLRRIDRSILFPECYEYGALRNRTIRRIRTTIRDKDARKDAGRLLVAC